MTDRIEQIRTEAERAIAGANDTPTLEDVRIRYLGRKAELPNLLRNVAELPPAERAATGNAGNEARQERDARPPTRRARSRRTPRARPCRRQPPRRSCTSDRAAAPDHSDAARDRG